MTTQAKQFDSSEPEVSEQERRRDQPVPDAPATVRLAPVRLPRAAAAVYVLSFVSQMLLSAAVTERMSVFPFVVVQAVLIAYWVMLHRRRLADAGRPAGMVIAVAAIYTIEIVL